MNTSKKQKPIFILLKSSQEDYTAAINIDDLKRLVIHKKGKMVVDVYSSNHSLTLPITQDGISDLEHSITKRYSLVTLDGGISLKETRDAYNAILKVSTETTSTYIWPRGISTVLVSNNEVAINIFGQEEALDHKLSTVPSTSDVIKAFKLLNIR
jgi:hypothetical protein